MKNVRGAVSLIALVILIIVIAVLCLFAPPALAAEYVPMPTREWTEYYTEADVVALAKVLYAECRGIKSVTEQACVAWVVCNRVDAGYADTILNVVKAPHQFAYRKSAKVTDELYELAEDVLGRWEAEKNGAINVGRVLPAEYLWFAGRKGHNRFRCKYKEKKYWDYSADSPYES